MDRRTFLSVVPGAAGLAAGANAAPLPFPVIDSHIHLFDPGRPQGVPWPPKDNPVLYKRAMPDRLRKLAVPHGVVGAIEVECSPLVEDNQWVLDVAAKDRIIVGTVGNLEPGKPEFAAQLEKLAENPLFRGIRCGTLWGRRFTEDVERPQFLDGLKRLASARLTMDAATASPQLIRDLLRVTGQVPELTVVIDHLPQMNPPEDAAARKAYESDLVELAKNPRVFVKISEVLRRVEGKVPMDLVFYKPRLDYLWQVFGEDRVIFGSDWPNSDNWAEYPAVFGIVREYAMSKGRAAAEKYFWRNSMAAYRWVKRTREQPGVARQ